MGTGRGSFLLASVAVLVLRASAPVHGQATDANGSIVTNQWLALGPFATPLGCDGNAGITGIYGNHIGPVHHIACEAPEEGDVVEGYDPLDPTVVTDALHPLAPQDASGNPMWYAWDDGTPLDGDQALGAGPAGDLDEHMIYLATYVEYLGASPVIVEFCFGSDDDGQVWVDDQLVHNQTACRGHFVCDDRFFVSMTPGVHVIKMAAWDQGQGWGAVLGLNVDGVAIQDGDPDWRFLGKEAELDLDCSPSDYQVYDPPSLLCRRNGDGSVELTWANHPETNPNGMISILVDGVVIATVPGGTVLYTVPAGLAETARSFCVQSAGGLRACTECRKVASDGLIATNAWMAIGPFNGPGCSGTQGNSLAPSFIRCEFPAIGDELQSGYDPTKAATNGLHEYAPRTADEQPIWYAFEDGTDDGDQDFNLGTPEPDNVVQYAVTYVEYVGAQPTVDIGLCLGSDDSMEVWINRDRVSFVSACRGRGTCQETVPVSLPGAGVYRIAAGVWDGCCGWGFTLGLQDDQGLPIFDDHPDWVFHGRVRPADFESKIPGGTACEACTAAPRDIRCTFGRVGLGDGLNVTWRNPPVDECDCVSSIDVKINGATVATVPPTIERVGILNNRLPEGAFEVTVTNCSGLSASCNTSNTNAAGLLLTQAWTAIGPFLGPGCNGTLGNSLAPSYLGCEYPAVGDQLTEGYDVLLAASGGLHQYAPRTPDDQPVWYAFDDGVNDGDQNFNLGVPEPDNVVQYAVTYVEYKGALSPVDINLCVGSDDSIDIWINDRRIFFLEACRGRAVCQDTVPVTLPGAGVYRIAVGVWDGCCDWGFSLALLDAQNVPILGDGSNPDWVFHGRDRPAGFVGPCPTCILPVSNLTCERGADGLTVTWENSEGCDSDIRVLLYGDEIATLPPTATSYQIPAATLPLPGAVQIDNGAPEVAQCSFIEETAEYTAQGFVKTWLMLGPYEQPSGCCPDCPTAALDYLTDGVTGEAVVLPAEGDSIATAFGGAAASTGLALTPNPDLNPNGVPTWSAHLNFDDTIDYNTEWYLGDVDNVMVYSAFYVSVAEDITVDIGVGSDDTIQVLVDGAEVGCVSGARGFGAADVVQDVFPDVELTTGVHLIMTKVFDGVLGHGHRLRFQRNGAPLVPGTISLEPGAREICNNGTDDDGDTRADCADADCATAPNCVASGFHRGDADQNGQLQLTDAVQVLGYLFLGSVTRVPECFDAADADDNGQVQLTDAVRILGYLFLGAGPPEPPGPPDTGSCGPDVGADDLEPCNYDPTNC